MAATGAVPTHHRRVGADDAARVRKAQQHMAMFAVDADAAQQMIDLAVCGFRLRPNRAVVVLDADALSRQRSRPVLRVRHQRHVVNPPGEIVGPGPCSRRAPSSTTPARRPQEPRWRPVCTIWGLPGRWLADLHHPRRHASSGSTPAFNEGWLIVGMAFRVPVCRSPGRSTSAQQEHRDVAPHTGGITREIHRTVPPRASSSRRSPGGAADLGPGTTSLRRCELAALGLPANVPPCPARPTTSR